MQILSLNGGNYDVRATRRGTFAWYDDDSVWVKKDGRPGTKTALRRHGLVAPLLLSSSTVKIFDMLFVVCAIAALLTGAFATPLAVHRVVHEKRSWPAPNQGDRVDPESIVPIRIGLKQNNLENGHEWLMDVSHPSSKNYGKHLSAAEVHDLFAPAEETVASVREWLLLAGIDASSIVHYENKGWLAVDIPAWQAEDLLSAEYYEHESKDGIRISCGEYSLPAHISMHVDYIKPGIKMSSPLKKRVVKRSSLLNFRGTSPPARGNPNWAPSWQMPPAARGLPPDLQNCGVNITPTCIKALYHIPNATASSPVNVMGLYETFDAFSQKVLPCWKD